MKSSILPLLIAASSLIAFSCQSIDLVPPRRASVILEASAKTDPLSFGRLSVSPQQILSGLEGSMEELVLSAAARRGLAIGPSSQAAEGDLLLDLTIQQRSYLSGFDERRSMTVILALRRDDLSAAQFLWSKDGASSLESFPLLYEVIDSLLADLALARGIGKK